MIKVMHVCSDTNIGGAGRYLLNLLEEADTTQFQLVFVVPYKSKLKDLLTKHGGHVLECALTPDCSFAKKDIGMPRRLMKEEKPDIVHTHASLSARIAAKLIGVKGLIYTRHYVDTTCIDPDAAEAGGLKNKLKHVMNNALCDGVIGVAHECEPVILAMGIKPEKITIIPNGVVALRQYNEEEKKAVRMQYGLENKHKVVTIMARLSKEKGHAVFIEVIETLLKTIPEVRGLIAGTGSETEAIKSLIAKKGLEDKVIMTGFVEDVEALINSTQIQMNTSYTEAQSLALSEAMSIGIPAVVTDAGGNPSMIRDGVNGYVAPVGDVKGLARCVEKLLKNDIIYREMSQGAKKVYEEAYKASKMTRSTEAFYKKVLKITK